MANFLDKLIGTGTKEKSNVEEYQELDLSEFEDNLLEEKGGMSVRIAELTGLEVLNELKKQVYDGNILIIDVVPSKHDKTLFDRVVKGLKQVAIDVNGDIAMIKDEQVIVTPGGVHINRQKIK
ncbi:MAG: cell division protein SepF [Candidatus Methanoperedenaceae archaeon]|nr:cell division protein SepF [Candidatus Methanoperedenaceae archaeon]MDW7727584.1 cell division protein SepF [Candidatus Methanoperedens sp.]